jgi:hypothetical protein
LENEAKPRKNKRTDYIVAIIANIVIIIIANVGLSFLNADYHQVLPLFNIALSANIIVNAIFLLFDPDWFTSLLRMVLNSLSLAVTVLFLRVFPFDFSEYPGFAWATLARVLLIIGIVGCSIAIFAEALKFLTALINFIRRR